MVLARLAHRTTGTDHQGTLLPLVPFVWFLTLGTEEEFRGSSLAGSIFLP